MCHDLSNWKFGPQNKQVPIWDIRDNLPFLIWLVHLFFLKLDVWKDYT